MAQHEIGSGLHQLIACFRYGGQELEVQGDTEKIGHCKGRAHIYGIWGVPRKHEWGEGEAKLKKDIPKALITSASEFLEETVVLSSKVAEPLKT